jgi:ABC-type proline/glycine betaine transport system ATPase subunit
LQDAFVALRERLAATCVIVTHDIHEALLLATTVAVMHRGRIDQIATPARLVDAPATDYVRALLTRARVSAGAKVRRDVRVAETR